MSDKTSIEWTDATWNCVRGCSRVSPGCGGANHEGGCYAEKIAARFSGPGQPFEGFAERTKFGGRWTGKMALVEEMLTVPLRWKKPRRIFVNSMSDLFHENLPDEAIDKVFAVMALAPQHTFQVLTKRSDRMRAYMLAPDVAARVWKAANDIAAEIERPHRLHDVRARYITEVAKVNRGVAKDAARHADPATTERYIAVAASEVATVLRGVPRPQKTPQRRAGRSR
jgi:protein gp37